ncbi:MAG: cupredoxin domain-containing protein [Actinobacteria bacterium]|nr:cupredoxin domain-containing protein [Actinomycetota bacterium]
MKKAVVAVALILAALALSACGSSSSTTTATETKAEETSAAESETGGAKSEGAGAEGAGGTIKIEANPEGQLKYEEEEVTAPAGKDTIEFTNESSLPHDVKVESAAGEVLGGTETVSGGTETAVVNLKPGTYTFYCSVPGHRQAGMEGKLVVK